jgi:hypothetical protein
MVDNAGRYGRPSPATRAVVAAVEEEAMTEALDLQWANKIRQEGGGRATDEQIAAHQPPWCGYPMAASGIMGCWSLWYGHVTGPETCHNCEEWRMSREATGCPARE